MSEKKPNICDALDFVFLSPANLKQGLSRKPESALEEEVVTAYIDTFAGEPWNEYMKCADCGKEYSEKESKTVLGDENARCKNSKCTSLTSSQRVILKPYYDRDEVKKEILGEAVSCQGFQGLAAVLYGKDVTGVAWGYELPKNKDIHTVRMTLVRPMIESKGIELSKPFYAAEIFVPPAFQGMGVGTELAYARFLLAQKAGYDQVFFRTKNTDMLLVYKKLFGEGNTRELFADPVKDTPWYFVEMNYLRDHREGRRQKPLAV